MSGRGTQAIQDLYPDELAHCFGCGRNNPQGHRLKSYVDGEEVLARFTPEGHCISIPGFVYGGLLASLVDCHAMATAAGADLAASGGVNDKPAPRDVTAALRVDYLKPTPLGRELEIRGRLKEQSERKKVVEVTVSASGTVTVRGEVVAVRIPTGMKGGQVT
jgi:acyl-coenzyme A thioesterase PaaI-like protein